MRSTKNVIHIFLPEGFARAKSNHTQFYVVEGPQKERHAGVLLFTQKLKKSKSARNYEAPELHTVIHKSFMRVFLPLHSSLTEGLDTPPMPLGFRRLQSELQIVGAFGKFSPGAFRPGL